MPVIGASIDRSNGPRAATGAVRICFIVEYVSRTLIVMSCDPKGCRNVKVNPEFRWHAHGGSSRVVIGARGAGLAV